MTPTPLIGVIFGRISTNRHTLKKYLDSFRRAKRPSEEFVAPRPLPGHLQSHYFALLKLEIDSPNCTFFQNLAKFEKMTKTDFQEKLKNIHYFWGA